MLPSLTSVTLRSGSTLLLDGPLSFRLLRGETGYFGTRVVPGAWLLVRRGKRIAVEALSDAMVEIRTEEGASHQVIDGSTIPVSWREASQIVQQVRGTIVILGSVDSGKSTLSTFLLNEAVSSNLSVGMVDGDIGQADIGPPTTIGGARITSPVFDLQNVTPDASFFVGDTSPGNVSWKVTSGLKTVHSRLGSAEIMIVNTDGWLEGPEAFNYKQEILEKLEPNLVLAIDDVDQRILNNLVNSQKRAAVKLERSLYARERTREERKRAREAGYRRFLKGAARIELRMDRMSVMRFDSQQSLLESPSNGPLQGVLSGLLDEEGMLLGICRVQEEKDKCFRVETAVREIEKVRTLELGSIVLSSDYEEIGFRSYT